MTACGCIREVTVLHSDHFTVYHDDWLSLLYGMKLHRKVRYQSEDFVEKENVINSTEIYNAYEYKIETYRNIILKIYR